MYYSDTSENLELVKRRYQKYYKDPTKLRDETYNASNEKDTKWHNGRLDTTEE